MVGEAVKGLSKKPYIFTKCERRWNEDRKIFPSLKADSIRKECEHSLRRLNVEQIDLYQIHWPEPDADIEEGWTEMAKLKEEGKVRWIGVSNFNVQQLERATKIAPVTSLQPPYSLLVRKIEPEILPFCRQHGIPFDRCGKIIVATTPAERRRLEALCERGRHRAPFAICQGRRD